MFVSGTQAAYHVLERKPMKSDVQLCFGTATGKWLLALALLLGLMVFDQSQRAVMWQKIAVVNDNAVNSALQLASKLNVQVRQLGGVSVSLPDLQPDKPE